MLWLAEIIERNNLSSIFCICVMKLHINILPQLTKRYYLIENEYLNLSCSTYNVTFLSIIKYFITNITSKLCDDIQ